MSKLFKNSLFTIFLSTPIKRTQNKYKKEKEKWLYRLIYAIDNINIRSYMFFFFLFFTYATHTIRDTLSPNPNFLFPISHSQAQLCKLQSFIKKKKLNS